MARIFLFIMFLPLLAAVGHDLWLFYENQDRGFMMTSLGFLWTNYHEESFTQAVEMMDKDVWQYVNMLLAQKAIIVTASLFVFSLMLAGIAKVIASALKR